MTSSIKFLLCSYQASPVDDDGDVALWLETVDQMEMTQTITNIIRRAKDCLRTA